MSRWFRFILAILVGALLGALYGWLVNPVEYVNTAPDALRIDYKANYVLMVAEAYQADEDLDLAAFRLAYLGDGPPVEIVNKTLLSAESHYRDSDVSLMRALREALESWTPNPEAANP
jgi:hypothetical protein